MMLPMPYCQDLEDPQLTDIEEAISFLLKFRGITAQPWTIAEDGEIGYFVVTHEEPSVLSGPTGVALTRLQLSAFGATAQEMRRLASAVRKYLQGFAGQVGGVEIMTIMLDQWQDISEPLLEGQKRVHFHRACDYLIQWAIGIPMI